MSSQRCTPATPKSEPPAGEPPDPGPPLPAPIPPAPEASMPRQPRHGVLLDIDGPLVLGGRAMPGAADALRRLRDLEIPFVLLSNTTRVTGAQLVVELNELGLDVSREAVVSVADIAVEHLHRLHPGARVMFLGQGTPLAGARVRLVERDADIVLSGGNGPQVTFEHVNAALRELLAGARLIAMHRSLTWARPDGPAIDIGPTVRGLEAASGARAVVLGKPSPHAFQAAADHIGVTLAGSVMVGDDLHNDVLAAQRLGMHGVLTLTGKTSPAQLAACGRRPDHVLDSVADLSGLLPRPGLPPRPSLPEHRSTR